MVDRLALISYAGKFTWFGASIMVLAFILPLYKKAVPLAVVLVILARLIEQFSAPDHFKKGNVYLRRGLAVMFAFFSLHVLGMFWSVNWDYGALDLEYKLSLLVFPLLYFPRVTRDILLWKRAGVLYLFGYFIFIVISLFNATLLYVDDGNSAHFFYQELSMWFHPSYQAMYGAWAILLIMSFAVDSFKIKHVLGIIVLLIYLTLLASKAGFISGVIALLIGGIALRKEGFNLKGSILFSLLGIALLSISIALLPQSRGRVQSTVDFIERSENLDEGDARTENKKESNAARTVVWQIAFDEFMTHPFGVGTGDIKDHLKEAYTDHGAIEAAEMGMNAHNQYLQSALTLGWLGLMLCLAMILLPLYYLVRAGRWIHAGFFLIFGFNLLVESMIEVQSGVVFFAFWFVLLLNDTEVPRPQMPFHHA